MLYIYIYDYYIHTYIVQTCWKIASQVVQRSPRLFVTGLLPQREAEMEVLRPSVCHLGSPWSWCHGAMVGWYPIVINGD